jgi:hypothetical protein
VFTLLVSVCFLATLGALLGALAEATLPDTKLTEVRSILTNWYDTLDAGDWTTLLQSGAHTTESIFFRLLGSSSSSVKALLTWSCIVSVATLICFGIGANFLAPEYAGFADMPHWAFNPGFWKALSITCTVNCLLSIPCLIVTRYALKRISMNRSIVGSFILLAIISYFTIGVILAAITCAVHLADKSNISPAETLLFAVFWGFILYAMSVTHQPELGAAIILLPSALPALLLLFVLLSAWLVFVTRPLTQRPLTSVVAYLCGLPKGRLATGAIVFGVISVLLLTGRAAWAELVSWL